MKKENIYRIFVIRGAKVMLDSDLAEIYQVPTMRMNEQVKRNKNRFPEDFMFQLTPEEKSEVIANCDNLARLKFSAHLPYAFTEHGVAMLSAVLRSERAVAMSVFIVRAFVKLRESLATNKDLAHKITEIELAQERQGQKIDRINDAVIQLIRGPIGPNGPVGFKTRSDS